MHIIWMGSLWRSEKVGPTRRGDAAGRANGAVAAVGRSEEGGEVLVDGEMEDGFGGGMRVRMRSTCRRRWRRRRGRRGRVREV